MKKLFLILLSIPMLGQGNQLSISIDSITTQNSTAERIFTLNYQIKNLTNETISFFLDTKKIISVSGASMRINPYYMVFQNKIYIPQVFSQNRQTFTEEAYTKFIKQQTDYLNSVFDSYKKSGGISNDKYWVVKNIDLMQNIMSLKSNEVKHFSHILYWDKTRYFKENDLEYIIDEKDFYEFDLTINLIKRYFKESLSKEFYSKIEKDKNFIEGVFTSNKIEIDFR